MNVESGADRSSPGEARKGVKIPRRGCRHHYGSPSKLGAEGATLLCTLFESTKFAGYDPHAFVLEATRHAIASPGTVALPEDLT